MPPARKPRADTPCAQQTGEKMITVQLVRSRIGATPKQRKILDALGLKRIRMVKEFKDTPAIRGMVAKIPHMVEVVR